MSSSAMAVFTKAEAHPWFVDAVRDIDLGASGTVKAFALAWDVFAEHEADPERWRGWVRMLVQRALTKAKKDPGGLLLTLLKDGSGDDLSKPKKASVSLHDHREQQGNRYLEQVRKDREHAPEHRLPLVALTYAHHIGLNVRELVRAWESAGCPDPTEFAFEGWDLCLQHAGVTP